ncbi:MAG TPA: histidine phosphatase family protein [Ktedonobacterales bacterium]|nr:histidine phosphatase family protein [Ktedonobacterales bacterium]
MTQLYLIRHGQAFCNVENLIAGMGSDVGLTPVGVAQAKRLRDRLSATGEIEADVLIASTLPRARQTAEIIAPAFNLPVLLDDDAQELRVGDADGLTWEQYIEKYGPPPDFREEPYRPLFIGGENWGEFVLRVGTTIDRIVREHEGQSIVLVCHGGFIDTSFLVNLGMNTLALPQAQFHTRNTSITHWERLRYGSELRWRLVRYNDDLHTRDIETDERIVWARFAPEPPAGSDSPTVPPPLEGEPTGDDVDVDAQAAAE